LAVIVRVSKPETHYNAELANLQHLPLVCTNPRCLHSNKLSFYNKTIQEYSPKQRAKSLIEWNNTCTATCFRQNDLPPFLVGLGSFALTMHQKPRCERFARSQLKNSNTTLVPQDTQPAHRCETTK